jgi:hypothetical protein
MLLNINLSTNLRISLTRSAEPHGTATIIDLAFKCLHVFIADFVVAPGNMKKTDGVLVRFFCLLNSFFIEFSQHLFYSKK